MLAQSLRDALALLDGMSGDELRRRRRQRFRRIGVFTEALTAAAAVSDG
jgi:acetyl-CoA carboxylase alpha subunit